MVFARHFVILFCCRRFLINGPFLKNLDTSHLKRLLKLVVFVCMQAVAKHIRKTITMSSAVVTNLVGPVQQMSLDKHPVKGLYFTLAGGPEVYFMNYSSIVLTRQSECLCVRVHDS